jgi:hypothetical protein
MASCLKELCWKVVACEWEVMSWWGQHVRLALVNRWHLICLKLGYSRGYAVGRVPPSVVRVAWCGGGSTCSIGSEKDGRALGKGTTPYRRRRNPTATVAGTGCGRRTIRGR